MTHQHVQLTLFVCLLDVITAGTPKKSLHSSCFDLEDGTHYLQILTNDELSLLSPSEQDYYITAPIVHAKCDAGYTIIDPSFDPSWISYFSSFHSWQSDIAGPDLDNHVTWNEWFLPSLQLNKHTNTNINDIDITYAISPDCNQCITKEPKYKNKVYYMSGDIFGCYWPIKDTIDSNKCFTENNINSKCSKCYSKDYTLYYNSYCSTMIYDANTQIFNDHSHCSEEETANKIPSIGINGQYCICYKPSTSTDIKVANWGAHYAIDSWDENYNTNMNYDSSKEKELSENDSNENNENDMDDEKVYIELYEYDFNDGTYIISQPGTYVIMEDIKFNFNPGGIKHPNGGEFAWRPENNLDKDNYYKDYYKMNWFAGIIIECNDVIIDLNGHTLEMDQLFYLQNRFFTIISLTNKLFINNNDITFTDESIEYKSANNIFIKNGIIGLSSHFGIFGINNDGIHLLNIIVKDFETHGIILNEYSNLIFKNIEIGPSIGNGKELKLNMRYTNARLMLPIFYNVLKYNSDEIIYFNDGTRGPYNMNDIINRLILRMDLAFEYIINGLENININSNEWKEAYELFINEMGVSEYKSIYGLKLLNGNENGMNEIDGLYIHNLIINPKQVIKIGISNDLWLRNSLNIPIDFSIATNSSNINDAIYYGDVYTDALIALKQLTDSWWLLGRSIIWNEFIEWTQSNKPLHTFYSSEKSDETLKEICGYDIVTGESKGVIGIEISNSYNIEIKNIQIDSLINMGDLQYAKCNNIETYYGNNAKGISILASESIHIEQLNVSKIVSFNGASYGIYNDNQNNKRNEKIITLNYGKFSHIDAGVKGTYDSIDISKKIGFNSVASSCSVYCNNENENCNNYISYYGIEEQCINGQIKCIKNQMMIHHECQIDVNYQTPIGIIYVNKHGKIDAKLKSLKDNKQRQTSIVFRGEYFACAIIGILAILAAIKCIYFKNVNDNEKDDQLINENSPLISHNQQIDYNNL